MDTGRIIAAIVFVLVVAAFFYDRILGWRALGIAEMGAGLWAIWIRRVPYGWEGHPPSGYLTGAAAVILGLIAMALGLVFVLAPEVIDDVLSNAQYGN